MSDAPRTPLKPAPPNLMAVDAIYGEDESFEVETPDFHFDWLATAENRPTPGSVTPPPTKSALAHWEKVSPA